MAAVAAVDLLAIAPAGAAELTYRPISPTFGGNPLNSGHLFGLAERQNQFTDEGSFARTSTSTSATSQADLFVRNLESRLLSALAGQVTDAIFGDGASDSGTIVFGDTTIDFVRGLEFITLTITDPNGATEIQIPILM